MAKRHWDHRREKSLTHNQTKRLYENEGIAAGKEFEDEHEFRNFLASWLSDRTLLSQGDNQDTDQTSQWKKKQFSEVTDIETEPETEHGFGDIGIRHELLELSYDHALASPLIIECKPDSFREGIEQALRYKSQSDKKYQEAGKYKILQTAIATPRSLSTGEITGRHGATPISEDQTHENYDGGVFPINFEAKRIYWKAGIGVCQSITGDKLVISFGESDVVVIQ